MEPFKGGTQMSNIISLQHSEEKRLNCDRFLSLDFLKARKWAALLSSTFPDRSLMQAQQEPNNQNETLEPGAEKPKLICLL